MPDNTKSSVPKIWLCCFYWLIFHSLNLTSHSGALHCKAESKSHTCILHWDWEGPADGGSEKSVQQSVAVPTKAAAGVHFLEQRNVLLLIGRFTVLYKSQHTHPSQCFQNVSFLFRTFLLWNILRRRSSTWGGRGKNQVWFWSQQEPTSGAAASGRGTSMLSVKNEGSGGPSLW